MEDRFGNLDVGKEADFVAVAPTRAPALRAATGTREQTLFGLLMATRETAIAGTYVRGRRLGP